MALALAITLILGIATFITLRQLDGATQHTIMLYEEAQQLDTIYANNLLIAQELDLVLAGANDTLIPTILAQNEDLVGDFSSYQALAQQYSLVDDIAFTVQNERLMLKIRQDIFKALNQYRSGDKAAAHVAVTQINESIIYLAEAVEQTATQRKATLAQQTQKLSSLQQQQIWVMLGVFVLGAVLLFGVTWGIARSIIGNLRRLSTSAHQIADGNYAHRIAVVSSDEISQLALSFNYMAASVQERQSQVVYHQELIAQRAAELEHTLAELRLTIDERDSLTHAIREISSPVLPVAPDTLVMPLIGAIDTERAALLTQSLLTAIERYQARTTILDVTGLPLIDTRVARTIIDATSAARLLGTQIILVGIRPELAQTMVGLGIDLSNIHTLSDLQSGIRYALNYSS
ncbi:MAG: HAMP domain-containing protein [Oscillochloris sp.]|nr:HAMP domain-containing protein [Oscillochloris sp.]